MQEAIDRAVAQANDTDVPVHDALAETIKAEIEDAPTAWDDALWELVRKHRQSP